MELWKKEITSLFIAEQAKERDSSSTFGIRVDRSVYIRGNHKTFTFFEKNSKFNAFC